MRRAAANRLVAADPPQQQRRILGLEVENQAVDLHVHQVVAVAEPQALLPDPVVNRLPTARHTVLQRPEHQFDGILHHSDRQHGPDHLAVRNHHAGILLRSKQISHTLQKTPFAPGFDDCILAHDPAERNRIARDACLGTDQFADALVEESGRRSGADRLPQAHRAPLLVVEQARNAVQAHGLQRVVTDGERPQRIDTPPHGPQLAPITVFIGEVSGNHQLSVALGLVQVVKRAVDGRPLGVEQDGVAVGRREAHQSPVDIGDGQDTHDSEQHISRHDLRFDKFGLLHGVKDTESYADGQPPPSCVIPAAPVAPSARRRGAKGTNYHR